MKHLILLQTLIGAAAVLALASAADARRVPIVQSQCDIAALGIAAASGVAYVGESDSLMITDDGDDLAYLVARDCTVRSSFSTAALGSSAPQGVAWDPNAREYAFVDISADEVFFADEVGNLLGQCDLAALGATSPSDIAYRNDTGVFYVTDDRADQVYAIDREVLNGGACNLIEEFDTAVFGSLAPGGLAWIGETSEFALADYFEDDVFLVSTSFLPRDDFDTASAFGASVPEGIAWVRGSATFYVVDSSADTLTEIDAEGTSEQLCVTADVGGTLPTDIAVKAGSGEFAVVDADVDAVYVYATASCDLLRTFDLSGGGINSPSGMSYVAPRDQLVISDTQDDLLYFVGYGTMMVRSGPRISDTAISGFRAKRRLDSAPQSRPDLASVGQAPDGVVRYCRSQSTCRAIDERAPASRTPSGTPPRTSRSAIASR